jgi:hypothetical protein
LPRISRKADQRQARVAPPSSLSRAYSKAAKTFVLAAFCATGIFASAQYIFSLDWQIKDIEKGGA